MVNLQHSKCFFPWRRIQTFVTLNWHTASCNTRTCNFTYAFHKRKRSLAWLSPQSQTLSCTVFRQLTVTAINVQSASRSELRPVRKDEHRRVDVHETHNYSVCFSGCTLHPIVPKSEEKFTKRSAHSTDAGRNEMSLTATTLTTLGYSSRWRPSISNFTDIGLDTKYRSSIIFTTLDKVWMMLYNHHKTRASLTL